MRLYLAGPMTGMPDHDHQAFRVVAGRLRAEGHDVICPADDFDGDRSLPWQTYLGEAVRQVTTADAVAVLPDWSRSKGARLEVRVAHALGLPVIDAATFVGVATRTLQALGLVDEGHLASSPDLRGLCPTEPDRDVSTCPDGCCDR